MTCEDEDVVAAAGPAPRRVRGDAVDDLPLAAVVGVPLLPAERALGGAPPELQLRGERREEGHEDDVGLRPVRDDAHGGGRCGAGAEEGGEEPVLGAVLPDEGAGGVGRVRARRRVVRVGGGRDAGVGGGERPVEVEQAVVERAGQVGDVDAEAAAVGAGGLCGEEEGRGGGPEEEEEEGEGEEEEDGEEGGGLHGRPPDLARDGRRRHDMGGIDLPLHPNCNLHDCT